MHADKITISFVRRRKYVYAYVSRTFRGKTTEVYLGRDLKSNTKAFARKMLDNIKAEIRG